MKLLERWFEEVWNQGREASIDELMHPESVAHGLTGPDGKPATTVPDFRAYYANLRNALTEINVAVESVITEGDLTAARCHVTARHTGEGLGIVPEGRPVSFSGMAWARTHEGRIVESWNNFDFMTMIQQLQ